MGLLEAGGRKAGCEFSDGEDDGQAKQGAEVERICHEARKLWVMAEKQEEEDEEGITEAEHEGRAGGPFSFLFLLPFLSVNDSTPEATVLLRHYV
jgi:hypothetical protein